jgi:hypothetical protein
VICAEAFHWISPDVRWIKTAAALKKEGSIALFWNGHHVGESELFQALEGVYRESAPQLAEQRDESPEELERETVETIGSSGLFGEVTVMRYPWRTEYSAERYVKLLSTYSPIQGMAADRRQNLFRAVQELIDRHGGAVECNYVCRLYVAQVVLAAKSLSEIWAAVWCMHAG